MAIATLPSIKKHKSDDDLYPSSDGKPMAETHKHLLQMIYDVEVLTNHFADQPDVYVCGNNFVYWEQGNPRAVVSPDCYVVFGRDKRPRDTYRVWEEDGIMPSFVLEITSKKTRRQDTHKKRPIYEKILRVPEYFLFDPTGDYLRPRFQGNLLVGGEYAPMEVVEGRLHSDVLGLDLVAEGERLRFFDPVRGEWLLTYDEMARCVETAEAEVERLRAEIESLRKQRQE